MGSDKDNERDGEKGVPGPCGGKRTRWGPVYRLGDTWFQRKILSSVKYARRCTELGREPQLYVLIEWLATMLFSCLAEFYLRKTEGSVSSRVSNSS